MDEDTLLFLGDWLRDSENDVFNKTSATNFDIIEAIYNLIEEWKSHQELINTLCLRLFGYYRTEGTEAKAFTLQFVPSLIYSYLSAIAQGDRKEAGSMHTLLLAIYNLEAGSEPQNPKIYSFRVPNITQPSVYHDTSSLVSSSLTETALKRLDPTNRVTAKYGPHPHLQSFNAENRLPALTALLRTYAHYLSMYSANSLTETCLAFRRLVAQGYARQSDEDLNRIPLSSPFLVEMQHILHSLTPLPITDVFSRLNSLAAPSFTSMEEGALGSAARVALEAVQRRVEVELFASPLLVSGALADSSHLSITGGSNGSPQMVSSGGGNSARWKCMITNASFRTKKLPDDITVSQVVEAEAAALASHNYSSSSATQLGSITEENDEPTGLKQSFRLSELVKKKNKPKAGKSKSNGSVPSESGGAQHSTDVNGVILNVVDWNSDGESKEEVVEIRRRGNEQNGSTPI